jgi:hypothetical protein
MLRTLVILAVLPALLLVLAACASLSEDECRGGDWAGIGFQDGTEGRTEAFFAEHRKACAEYGIAPAFAPWAAGRAAGLERYCTPATAYAAGRRGNRLSPVCGQAALAAMLPAYDWGARYHDIGEDIASARREQDDLRAEIAALAEDGGDDGGNAAAIASLRRQILRIDLDILTLESRQARYARWPG